MLLMNLKFPQAFFPIASE